MMREADARGWRLRAPKVREASGRQTGELSGADRLALAPDGRR